MVQVCVCVREFQSEKNRFEFCNNFKKIELRMDTKLWCYLLQKRHL